MSTKRIPTAIVAGMPFALIVACAASWLWAAPAWKQQTLAELTKHQPPAVSHLPRSAPLVIEPLYDDPSVVTDDELAEVLAKVRPLFSPEQMKPNHVEHALRTWSLDASFTDGKTLSGQDLKVFLTDHGQYLASWGTKVEPLLIEKADGVAVRWGKTEGGSVHHDHWLASLTEAGATLAEPVFTPGRHQWTIGDVLQEALRDFRPDETEVEWSALAFGLWLPPQKAWITKSGREVSFDLLATRLIRGHQKYGVCVGTHRVYSLTVLLRLDEQFSILSPGVREAVKEHLRWVRDQLLVSQFPDGHWPSNWSAGASALEQPIADELYRQVIATGHHLEWLAIAPEEFHPPRAQVIRAARWAIDTTKAQTPAEITGRYTFFSHVGNALALWRKTHPATFWKAYEREHPARIAELTAPAATPAAPAAVPDETE